MFALPYQSTRMWKETLQEVCRLRPEHISCYALIVEEGTPIYESVKSGLIDLPDEDTDRDMYNIAKKILNENAYYQYEISNFSRKGFECLHNIIYWRNQDYLGIGAGSHSKLKARRFWNEKDIKKYISIINKNEIPIDAYEDIAIDEDMWETIILGLRLNEGIDFDVFKVRYSKDFMKIYGKETCELEGDGLIDINRNGIRLTEKGMDLSNIVFLKFMK